MYGAGGSFYGVGTAGVAGVAGVAGANGQAGANGAAGAAGAAGAPAPTAVAIGTRLSNADTASALTVTTARAANTIYYMRYRHAITNAYSGIEATITTAAAAGTRLTLCLFKSTANAPAGLVWYSAPIAADAATPFAASVTFATGTKVIAGEFVGNNFTPVNTEYWFAFWVENTTATLIARASALAAVPILDFNVAPWGVNDARVYGSTGLAWVAGAPTDPAAAPTWLLTVPINMALIAA